MPNLPWNVLLNQLPTMMRAVDALIETTSRRTAARDAAPAIDSLQRRVAALEEQQRISAELLKQVTEHVGAVEAAGEATAAMLRRAVTIATAAAVIALVALAIGIVLWVRG